RERKALIPARLVTREPVAEIPAPRALRDVAGNRPDVPDLRRGDAAGRLGQHGVLLLDGRMPADVVYRRVAADGEPVGRRGDLIGIAQTAQADDDVGFDDAFLDEAEQIAAAARERHGFSALVRVLGQLDGLLDVARIRVRKRFHASAPRILSRVIGKSFMRLPIALKIAFPTAPGDKIMPDSPMLFAPHGPWPSSFSMNVTSMGTASRWVRMRS